MKHNLAPSVEEEVQDTLFMQFFVLGNFIFGNCFFLFAMFLF